MENASKALIMAGSILIAMIVVGLLVWGFGNISRYNRQLEDPETIKQINEKNKEIESYNKRVVRGYEIVSLMNLIEDTNKRFSEELGFKKVEAYIKFLDGTTVMSALFKEGQTTNDILKKTRRDLTEGIGIKLSDFKKGYDVTIERDTSSNFAKIFKESYFQCDDIKYDGEEGKGSALVNEMYFSQITRKDGK